LCCVGARTPDISEIEATRLNDVTKSAGCFGTKFGFGLAGGAVCLRGVETD